MRRPDADIQVPESSFNGDRTDDLWIVKILVGISDGCDRRTGEQRLSPGYDTCRQQASYLNGGRIKCMIGHQCL